MKTLFFFIVVSFWLVVLAGCRVHPAFASTEIDTNKVEYLKDTTIFSIPESENISLFYKCDSMNSVILLDESKLNGVIDSLQKTNKTIVRYRYVEKGAKIEIRNIKKDVYVPYVKVKEVAKIHWLTYPIIAINFLWLIGLIIFTIKIFKNK